MLRSELKQRAKSQISGSVLILFFMILIANIDAFMASIMSNFANFTNVTSHLISSIQHNDITVTNAVVQRLIWTVCGGGMLVWLISLIILSPLKVSLARTFLRNQDGEKPEFSMLIWGYKNCWEQSALLALLKDVFVTLWSLLFVIPGIIKYYSYSMANYILAENPEMKALDAITESKKLMKGYKFKLFVLDLSFFLWYLLEAITLGLAGIYVQPYVEATKANFYLSIKENQ